MLHGTCILSMITVCYVNNMKKENSQTDFGTSFNFVLRVRYDVICTCKKICVHVKNPPMLLSKRTPMLCWAYSLDL